MNSMCAVSESTETKSYVQQQRHVADQETTRSQQPIQSQSVPKTAQLSDLQQELAKLHNKKVPISYSDAVKTSSVANKKTGESTVSGKDVTVSTVSTANALASTFTAASQSSIPSNENATAPSNRKISRFQVCVVSETTQMIQSNPFDTMTATSNNCSIGPNYGLDNNTLDTKSIGNVPQLENNLPQYAIAHQISTTHHIQNTCDTKQAPATMDSSSSSTTIEDLQAVNAVNSNISSQASWIGFPVLFNCIGSSANTITTSAPATTTIPEKATGMCIFFAFIYLTKALVALVRKIVG